MKRSIILANTKNQPVTVGQFSPTDLPSSNAAVGIEQVLVSQLKVLAATSVSADAMFEVKGDIGFVKSRATPELKAIKIIARIIRKEDNEELKELRVTAEMTDNKTLAEILQATASLPDTGTKRERQAELEQKARNPKAFIRDKTRIASSEESPYEIELRVKPLKDHEKHAATAREATDEKGQAFVRIDRDELYEVVVHNKSDREVAVALTIDGLDVFHFSKDRVRETKEQANGSQLVVDRPRFTHFIVAKNSSATIVGWHHSLQGERTADGKIANYLSFLVTAHGQGAVTKAGITARGNVGVIHAQFSLTSPAGKGRSGSETGFGPPREVKQTAVERDIDPPSDFVTVRYAR
jgi:hypothetical protein